MATDHLGPFDLEIDVIEANVVRSGPGNYRLGHNDIWGQFSVRMIGRSDDDIKAELRKHAMKKKYTRFTFAVADTMRQAYDRVCKDFHKYRGNGYLDTLKHPYCPQKHNFFCPICKKVFRPPSEEVKFDPTNTRNFSSSTNLQLIDGGDVKVDNTLRPWEVDEKGQRVKYRTGGEEKEMKPWEWDQPDLVPLDEEEIHAQIKSGIDEKKSQSNMPVVEWLEDTEEVIEGEEITKIEEEIPKQETKIVAEWLIDDEEVSELKNSEHKDQKKKNPWEEDKDDKEN